MKSKYIFRIDDICKNMNWDNYSRIKSIFVENSIQPIIGVIPNNEDEELKKYPLCEFDFWEEVRHLQKVLGWSIALHGYDHKLITKDSGILGINKKSEFAGLTKKEQCTKIRKGKEIFINNHVTVDAFMAPAHSFDKVTMECLLENGINVITDGFGYYPFQKYGLILVPQLYSKPKVKNNGGLYTWCLHTNSMTLDDINSIEKFVKNNKGDIISFSDHSNYITNSLISSLQRILSRIAINTARRSRIFLKYRSVKK